MSDSERPILAVASMGGHWRQLVRLVPALEDHKVVFVTTPVPGVDPPLGARLVPDANASEMTKLVRLAFAMLRVMYEVRPTIVISTGAAPGFFAVLFGKIGLKAMTIWVDSAANADRMSLAGRLARRFSDHWLTQWPKLARDSGPRYRGALL